MVPVIKAIAAASSTFRDQVSDWAAEKLLFNIGRIPGRQSRQAVLQGPRSGKSCRRAEKGVSRQADLTIRQPLN
jgi:hypothetical protein